MQTMIRKILFLCSMIFFGCVPIKPDLTREQWLDMTSHTFKNTTVNKVLSAGEKVLRLADPSDVTIYHLKDKMVGNRKYLIYMVFAAEVGSYNFDLTANQIGTDVEAHLLIGHSSQPIMATMTSTPGVQGGGLGATASAGIASIGVPVEWPDPYKLFFSRVETLLYSWPWWEICDDDSSDSNTRSTEALCFYADDNIPEGVKLSYRSAKIITKRKQPSSW